MRRRVRGLRMSGLTLLELMLVLGVMAALILVGQAAMADYRERVRVQQAITDIAAIGLAITQHFNDAGEFPADLAAVGHGGATDPWGNAYHYTDLTGPGNGRARKDRRLNPLNSDFDLFSAGKDGVYKTQISHRDSLDDVIRARDGRFVDLAEKF